MNITPEQLKQLIKEAVMEALLEVHRLERTSKADAIVAPSCKLLITFKVFINFAKLIATIDPNTV